MTSLLHTVHVDLGPRSYPILIGTNLLESLGADIRKRLSSPTCFIVVDARLAATYGQVVQQSLHEAGLTSHVVYVPSGEGSKSFAGLEKLVSAILNHRPERSSLIVAVGGGVIGDLAGFAASILLRGVPFIQVPTTLLSQVDSSVGGKTGINTSHGKNLIGSFYQPRLVMADLMTLSSLPMRELKSGYAEVVKYGVIDRPDFFRMLEKEGEKLAARDIHFLATCVRESCEAKAAIVGADERESSARALLNLGHTFGHALEAATGFSEVLLHGESVALGMVLAMALSVRLQLCSPEDYARVKRHLTMMGLPTTITSLGVPLSAGQLLESMYQDKKVQGGKLVFILARGIGQAFIAKDIEASLVLSLLEDALTKGLD